MSQRMDLVLASNHTMKREFFVLWTEHPLKQRVQMRTVCHNTY